VQQVQLLVFTTLALLLAAPFMGLGGIALAVHQDVPLSVVVAIAIPVTVVTIGFLISRMVPPSRMMQGYLDAVNRVMREQITGIRVIRAFARDAHERRRFAAANTNLMAVGIRMGRVQAFFGASSMLIADLVLGSGGDDPDGAGHGAAGQARRRACGPTGRIHRRISRAAASGI
jgi:ATP-binding cassette subfamily B protein